MPISGALHCLPNPSFAWRRKVKTVPAPNSLTGISETTGRCEGAGARSCQAVSGLSACPLSRTAPSLLRGQMTELTEDRALSLCVRADTSFPCACPSARSGREHPPGELQLCLHRSNFQEHSTQCPSRGELARPLLALWSHRMDAAVETLPSTAQLGMSLYAGLFEETINGCEQGESSGQRRQQD